MLVYILTTTNQDGTKTNAVYRSAKAALEQVKLGLDAGLSIECFEMVAAHLVG